MRPRIASNSASVGVWPPSMRRCAAARRAVGGDVCVEGGECAGVAAGLVRRVVDDVDRVGAP